MSTSGHLVLRGAPHLALVSLGGGGEERGGEKRLVEWNRTEQRCEEERHCRAGNQLRSCKLSSRWLILAATLAVLVRWREAGGNCQRSWQREERSWFSCPGRKQLHPFLKRCSQLYLSWRSGCGLQPPSTEMCWLGEQKCTFLMSQDTSGELLLERGGARRGISVSFSMFSWCSLGSHCHRRNFDNIEMPKDDHVGS